MVLTSASAAKIVPDPSKYTGAVIDTDVHETFTSWDELIPYLKHPWRGLIERKAWTPPSSPFAYWASHGLNRADSLLPSGAPAGSDYELFKQQVLDAFSVKFALLTAQ